MRDPAGLHPASHLLPAAGGGASVGPPQVDGQRCGHLRRGDHGHWHGVPLHQHVSPVTVLPRGPDGVLLRPGK